MKPRSIALVGAVVFGPLALLACASTGTPLTQADGGDGGISSLDSSDSDQDAMHDCGLRANVACRTCVSEKCCDFTHVCEKPTPHCDDFAVCVSTCSLDAAACDCYVNFQDITAQYKLLGDCTWHQCIEAGLCN